MSGRYMNDVEAAKYLGISVSVLRNGRANGTSDIPFSRVGVKRIVYDKVELDSYISSRKIIPCEIKKSA